MNKEEIKNYIPHRDPFLLIDSVSCADENKLTAAFKVDKDSPLFKSIFPGHYPGNPITPGVILCEIIFQAGAILMSARLKNERADSEAEADDRAPVVTRIRDARFKNIVRPGDDLEVSVEFEDQVSNAYYLKGSIKVNGKLSVRVAFTCALAEVE